MPILTLGDRTLDLAEEILVVDAADAASIEGLVRAGVVDLGSASESSLAALSEARSDLRNDEVLMMRFDADQLPELAVALVRGVRVVCTPDTEAATRVATVLTTVLDAVPDGDSPSRNGRRT